MIFDADHYKTHNGEIFQLSCCLQHEHATSGLFHSLLTTLGYRSDPNYWNRRWTRSDKTVIVSLGDDFNLCGADTQQSPAQWFDSNTVVITDNHAHFSADYQIKQLPSSYYGIYAYLPTCLSFEPTHRLGFCVNRLDSQRQLLLLEMIKQCGSLATVLHENLINFNCWDAQGNNETHADLRQNFQKYWMQINSAVRDYEPIYQQVVSEIPIKNYTQTIEQVHMSVYVNAVIETYSGNHNTVLTEKTFRALSSPAPWILFVGKGSIEYLRTLGFDVLDDLIDHSYDSVDQTWPGTEKIRKFIGHSLDQANKLQKMDQALLKNRCQVASLHNRTLLQQMKLQWPADFVQYLTQVIKLIQ